MKRSPSPMHLMTNTLNTLTAATPQAPSTQTPSTHSLVTQQISTPPTTPTASATSVMKRSFSLMHHSQQTPSTRSTATPQAPSTQTPSTPSLVPRQSQHRLRLRHQQSGDEEITLSDASLAANTLNTLDSNTTGTINTNTVAFLWCRSRSQHLRLRRHRQPQ